MKRPTEPFDLYTFNRPIDIFKHWDDDGHLLMTQPYQRGVVWSKAKQRNLIFSLLFGIPVPSIVLNDRFRAHFTDSAQYAVIDGKQRITAILAFIRDELSIPGDWVDLPLKQVRWSQIDIVTRRRFENKSIPTNEGILPTVEMEYQVYKLINYGGVPHDRS